VCCQVSCEFVAGGFYGSVVLNCCYWLCRSAEFVVGRGENELYGGFKVVWKGFLYDSTEQGELVFFHTVKFYDIV